MSEARLGRPSLYTEELADTICGRLMDGESLRRICRDDGLPDRVTVLRWLDRLPAFATKYARAREVQGDVFAAETIEIADEEEDPQRARVRVLARQWMASKLAPKKYGDRLTTEHTGANGGPIQTEDLTAVDLGRRIAFALAKAASEQP